MSGFSGGAAGGSGISTGTWTPGISAATPGDLSVAYTTQTGNYTLIGSLVIAQFTIVTSTYTFTTASGNLRITGLPFTVNDSNPQGSYVLFERFTKASMTQLSPQPVNGQTYCEERYSGQGQATATTTLVEVATGGTVRRTGFIIYTK